MSEEATILHTEVPEQIKPEQIKPEQVQPEAVDKEQENVKVTWPINGNNYDLIAPPGTSLEFLENVALRMFKELTIINWKNRVIKEANKKEEVKEQPAEAEVKAGS